MTEQELREYRRLNKQKSRAKLRAAKTKEEISAINRANYQKNRERYKAKAKLWNQANPHYQQAAVHTSTIKRRYPEVFAESSLTRDVLRDWLKDNSDVTCRYCGSSMATHIDHRIPLSLGGKHELSNLQKLCRSCNFAKSDMSEEQFFEWVGKVHSILYGN